MKTSFCRPARALLGHTEPSEVTRPRPQLAFFVLLGSPSKKRGASCLGGRFSWGKNGAGEESRHKITLLPKVINRDRYNYKRTRYHLPSLNGRWPSDTQVDLVLDSGHIINQQRSPSHHLSQSFRPPSLAARQLQSLFV